MSELDLHMTLSHIEGRNKAAERMYHVSYPEDVHTMIAALRAVIDLHQPFAWSFGQGPVKSCKYCAEIGANEEQSEWPCPTIKAIAKEVHL